MRILKQKLIYPAILYAVVCFTGCTDPGSVKDADYLIKTSSLVISSEDFLEELDLKRASYPYTIRENPAEYNEMVIHLVKVLSEEAILLSAAQKRGVGVTDRDVQLAENEFKKDYPDDSFDQILLKNAISYPFWKKRFKKNMIMNKLIEQELKQKIEITAQDIIEFYNQSLRTQVEGTDDRALVLKRIQDEKELVSRLRMQKTQDQYDEWMERLKNQCPVDINKEKLKTFLIDVKKNEGSENGKED